MTNREKLFQGSYSYEYARLSGEVDRHVFYVDTEESRSVGGHFAKFAEFCARCNSAAANAKRFSLPVPQLVLYEGEGNCLNGKYSLVKYKEWDGVIPENVAKLELV